MDRQPWELTDDDYIKAVNTAAIGPYYIDSSDVSDIDRAIATAAQKRLVEHLEKHNDGAAFWGLGGFVEEGDVLITALNWVCLKAALGVGND